MSLREALHSDNLLCYEMNGASPVAFARFPGKPDRPGLVRGGRRKWLTRIEVVDHRYAGRFMARDYVTVREEQRDGETIWTSPP